MDFKSIRQNEIISLVDGLLLDGKYEEVRDVIAGYAEDGFANPYFETDILKKLKLFLRSAEDFIAQLDVVMAGDAALEKVSLKSSPLGDRKLLEPGARFVLDDTFFGEICLSPSVTEYWAKPNNINPDNDLIDRKGFSRPVPKVVRDRIFVQEHVRFCVSLNSARTCFDGRNVYIPTRSGRVARRVGVNLAQKPMRVLETAYILPFSFAARNYYHAFEMVYGLRFANYTDPRTPIIYEEDHFKILDLACDALGIDKSRLIKADSVADAAVRTAFLPDGPPFFGDCATSAFFQDIARFVPTIEGARHVYISRSRTTRRPPLEDQLSAALSKRGFNIVHTENMSFGDQVALFKSAHIIVAPHGAGLANLGFCKPGVRLIEIFNPDFVATDFYRRSLPINANYSFIVSDVDGDYIADLMGLI